MKIVPFLGPEARVRRTSNLRHAATRVAHFLLLVSTACGGKSESPKDRDPKDAGTCTQGVCATGGQSQGGEIEAGHDAGGAVTAGGSGGTGGTGGTLQMDAGSTSTTGGTGGEVIQPPPPPGVGCGNEVCELGSGLKCCWAPATDTYQCAETCPPDTQTFECDDDGDCPDGTECSWFGDGPDYTAPYRTACVAPGSTQRDLDCHWSNQCADGMTCCAELQELWIAEEGVFKHVINGTLCVPPEDCPASAGAAPFCRSDADCPDRRKCVRLDDAPSSMQTCSGLADSVTDAVLIDCGDTQCVKELGLVCDSRWPRPEGVLACPYRDPDWFIYDSAANELQCDEDADCPSAEACVLGYNSNEDVNTVCTTDPPSDARPLCKSNADCADSNYTCCVLFELGGLNTGLQGPVAITCVGVTQCTSSYAFPRCQTDADCAVGKHCYDTNVTGVRVCY